MLEVLDQIQILVQSQLYEDVKTLANLALTFCEHNQDLFSAMNKYQILCSLADSYFYCSQFKQAEVAYRNALQFRKMVGKGKGKAQTAEVMNELDVRFRLHECYVHLRQLNEAIHILESISSKQRSAKVNIALGRLYQRAGGNDRSAVTAYKEVLRECPMSITAMQGLLSLGVKWQEVEQYVRSSLPQTSNCDWLSSWLKAHGLVANKEFAAAVTVFKMLDNKPLLRDSADLLASLGETHFFNGDFTPAVATLQRIRAVEPLYLKKMDLLAFLYMRDQSARELEQLATSLITVSETVPEPWVAMGYFSLLTKKHPKAVYFAQKALSLDSRHVEALLLKGSALVELKRIPEAVSHFREALRLAPHRFEPYNSLIECYMSTCRARDALACASEMCKQICTCRSLTTYARVLAKEPLTLEKAKGYLEKALKLDPNSLDAVCALARVFGQQKQYDAAVKLLKSNIHRHSNSVRYHNLLAEFMTHVDDREGAADHLAFAMRIDPFNAKAADGLAKLEKLGDGITTDRAVEDIEAVDASDEDQYQQQHTPQDRRVPPIVDLDTSMSDEGELDINSDAVFN